MPELPEVETIKEGLKDLSNKQISKIYRSDKKLRFESSLNLENLKNLKVTNIKRRARYLLIELEKNKTLIVHLGMSGKINIKNQFIKEKHDHLALEFKNSKEWLVFNDARRFGFVDLIDNDNLKTHKMLAKLGPEPLSKEFNQKYLKSKLKNKSTNIKTTMMDNEIVVGVGNIYINESLFEARILPYRTANSLTDAELKKLIAAIKTIIKKAIKLGGSSISDYVKASGDMGKFQNSFKVYGRADKKTSQKCLICNNEITRIVQNGRSTFYCNKCQK